MESNWRWNVWKIGLANYVVALAARIPGTFDWYRVKRTDTMPFEAAIAVPSGPDGAYELTAGTLPPPGHPHFPYGTTVDPD